MRLLATSGLLILSALVSGASQAQERSLPPVFVYAEADDAANIKCAVLKASYISAAEAALRYNRVSVASREDAMSKRALLLYLNANVISMTSNMCVVSFGIVLKSRAFVTNPVTSDIQFADIVYCDRGSMLTGGPIGLTTRVNDLVKRLVDTCLSTYAKS